MTPITDLSTLDATLETILSQVGFAAGEYDSDATGLQLLDRLEQLTHLGVRVDYPETDDQTQNPGNASEGLWCDDHAEVVLMYQLRTKGQRESRRRAWQLERLIRLAVTGASELQGNQPRYFQSRRSTPKTGWHQVVMTFLIHRDLEVR